MGGPGHVLSAALLDAAAGPAGALRACYVEEAARIRLAAESKRWMQNGAAPTLRPPESESQEEKEEDAYGQLWHSDVLFGYCLAKTLGVSCWDDTLPGVPKYNNTTFFHNRRLFDPRAKQGAAAPPLAHDAPGDPTDGWPPAGAAATRHPMKYSRTIVSQFEQWDHSRDELARSPRHAALLGLGWSALRDRAQALGLYGRGSTEVLARRVLVAERDAHALVARQVVQARAQRTPKMAK